MRKLLLLCSFAALLGSSSAMAAMGEKGDWEFGPYVGAGFPDNYGPADLERAAFLLGLRLGYSATSHFSLEPSFQRSFARTQTGTEVNMDAYRLNLLWNFRPGHTFRPFFTAGGGLERAGLPGSNEKDFAPNGGLGFKWYASDFGGVRVDGRYIPVKVGGIVGDWQHNFEGMASVFFLFGNRAPKAAPVVAAAAPSDSDGDGVVDTADKCPGTAAGVKVDANGCAIYGDSDGDGVKDNADKCANTPQGVKVDEHGCAIDADGDGVKDDMDKCLNTPAGTKVDANGCPLVSKARGVLKGVTFKTSKAELTDEAKKVLDEVAVTLNEVPSVKAEVQGHTDSIGDAKMNTALSQARAESVLNYLVSKGVAKDRLTAKGYGPTKPVADNKTKAGRAQNRRVELNWLD